VGERGQAFVAQSLILKLDASFKCASFVAPGVTV